MNNVVKEMYAIYLTDTGEDLGLDNPRPCAEGYVSTLVGRAPFKHKGILFPRCTLLLPSAKLYVYYNTAFCQGDRWKMKCPYVDSFIVESVGILETGERVPMRDVVKERANTKGISRYDPRIFKAEQVSLAHDDLFWGRGIRFYMPDGEEVLMYSSRHVAVLLGRTTQQVRRWEISGRLPDTGFMSGTGLRLYTREQLEVVVRAAERAKIAEKEKFIPVGATDLFTKWVARGFEVLRLKRARKEVPDAKEEE